MIIRLSKCFLERVRPQAKADDEQQLKLQCQAHTCGNALLYTGFLSSILLEAFLVQIPGQKYHRELSIKIYLLRFRLQSGSLKPIRF